MKDHAEATRLVLSHVPEIPNWVQLPLCPNEGMVTQFMEGLPALVREGDRCYIDSGSERFERELVLFFEEYLAVAEQAQIPDDSRFALTTGSAPGFFSLLSAIEENRRPLFAIKGQITGPITFCTSLTDQERRAIFYDDTLRDAALKMLALKAAWQVQRLSAAGAPVIVFIDEPALAGYGSSELISISREDIGASLTELVAAIHAKGGLAGVHVCANTDWSILLSSAVDIINFDAYGYLDKFLLYGEQLRSFLERGGCLAWGLVPTAHADQVAAATPGEIWELWQNCLGRSALLGVAAETVQRQSFITPSCGTGSLTPELSLKVLRLTRDLSARVRGIT